MDDIIVKVDTDDCELHCWMFVVVLHDDESDNGNAFVGSC